MKLKYTTEDVERWRDRVHRRRPRLAVRTKEQAVRFVNEVGFCYAFKTDNSELPCLWNAACGQRNPPYLRLARGNPYLSFVWEMKRVLPAERTVYYGHVFRRRPSMISTGFFPFFYALSRRTGSKEDYLHEFHRDGLSSRGKAIMEALGESSPQVTRGLKMAVGAHSRSLQREFDKAMVELQGKFYIVKVGEHHDPFTFEWNTVDKAFPKLVRQAARISPDVARRAILTKFFENQLVGTVRSIHSLFGWKKQSIYEVLGHLMKDGVITTGISVDGKAGHHYCFVH